MSSYKKEFSKLVLRGSQNRLMSLTVRVGKLNKETEAQRGAAMHTVHSRPGQIIGSWHFPHLVWD